MVSEKTHQKGSDKNTAFISGGNILHHIQHSVQDGDFLMLDEILDRFKHSQEGKLRLNNHVKNTLKCWIGLSQSLSLFCIII